MKRNKTKTCFHETLNFVYYPDKKRKLYESRDGLIINDLILIDVKYLNTKVYLAITNYGIKICLNIPSDLQDKCCIFKDVSGEPEIKRGKIVDDNFAITFISWFQDIKGIQCEQEPVTIWLDNKGNIINKYRIIDFKYNKFIEKCEDYISDMKVGNLTDIVGDLGNISAVFLMTKFNKFLKRKFIRRSKTNE